MISKKNLIVLSSVVLLLILIVASQNVKKPSGTIADKNSQQNSSNSNLDSSSQQSNISSLKMETLQEGSGDKVVKADDTVVVNYTGTLEDGTVFDSSYKRNQPFETRIGVGQVIQGWDQGIIGMKVGEKRKLTIPPELGYGNTAMPGIPAGSTLIFEVELLEIK
jgi:FKBP-type peptidyl-prolyl cis-trans isomerase